MEPQQWVGGRNLTKLSEVNLMVWYETLAASQLSHLICEKWQVSLVAAVGSELCHPRYAATRPCSSVSCIQIIFCVRNRCSWVERFHWVTATDSDRVIVYLTSGSSELARQSSSLHDELFERFVLTYCPRDCRSSFLTTIVVVVVVVVKLLTG